MTTKRLDALGDREMARVVTFPDPVPTQDGRSVSSGILAGSFAVRTTVVLALICGAQRVWTEPLPGDMVATITKEE